MSKKNLETSTVFSEFVEISIDPSFLNNFSNEQSMASFLSNISTDDFCKLKAELIKEVMYIINHELTQKQKDIIKMAYIEGKTQNEISKVIGNNQTAVHKAIAGNIDYANNKKRYGGALKKIKKLCKNNKKIQRILAQIREISERYE
jgi:DNA-directed RNA polymerase specialized sigma subunit